MNVIGEYSKNVIKIISEIEEKQSGKIKSSAALVADVIKNDNLIHIFGCGHSHLVALDSFYRAGGLANISPILDTDLMLHNGAAKSSAMEKMEGIAGHIFRRYNIKKGDILFVISSSGKNPVPVEMALTSKTMDVYTIAITSSEYFGDKPCHKSGMMLFEAADDFIDNHVPHGDASVTLDNGEAMGPLSTYASSFIISSIMLEASVMCLEAGYDPPVYRSGNIEGGADFNESLIDRYIPRIKHL